ncbi:MAG: hypothetical protein O9327_03440 [Polaromonas sp.]|nr:hypothetical protein [Polaromonas sp.]
MDGNQQKSDHVPIGRFFGSVASVLSSQVQAQADESWSSASMASQSRSAANRDLSVVRQMHVSDSHLALEMLASATTEDLFRLLKLSPRHEKESSLPSRDELTAEVVKQVAQGILGVEWIREQLQPAPSAAFAEGAAARWAQQRLGFVKGLAPDLFEDTKVTFVKPGLLVRSGLAG